MKQRLIQNDEEEAQNEGPVNFTRKFSLQDERLYELPGRAKCDFDGTRGKYKPYDQLMAAQPDQLKQATNLILEHFKDVMTAWELPQNFQFNLPPTYFNVKIDVLGDNQNQIGHQQLNVRELNGQHISQIFQSGTFTIPSADFPIPYVWRLSTWIMKGREDIIKSYYDDLSIAYLIFRWTYHRFYNKRDYKGNSFPLTLRAGIYNTLIKPFLYISLIIGFRETKRSRDGHYASLLLEAQRQRKLKDQGNYSQEIYKFLEVQYDADKRKIEQNFKKLSSYGSQFNTIADGIKFQIDNLFDLQNEKKPQILQVEDEEKLEFNDQILQNLNAARDFIKIYNLQFDPKLNIEKQTHDLQYEAQKKYWQGSKEFHLDMIQNIFDISECKRIQEYHQNIYSQNISNIEKQYEIDLRKNHPIRSKIYEYVVDEIKNHMKPIKQKLQAEMEQNILNELNEQQIIDRYVYQDYLEFVKTFDAKRQRIYNQYGWKERNYQFQLIVTRCTFPPFEIVQSNNLYYLVRTKQYTITTKYPFWRISIGFFRWYTWTMNVMFNLFANAFAGPFGLRALFGISEFHPDVTIDSYTGVVKPSHYTVKTLICYLSEVYTGMSNSRDNFERQPDNGFFGKNCARICNLIEVYIFRFLFVGVICVTICFPILVIINVVISLLFALTAWLYMPIVLFLCFIFQLLIYDFDYELDGHKIWQTNKCFPLITNTLRWVFQGIFQLFGSILAAFVILPLLSILMFIYAHIRYLLRSLYDIFMICLIYCFGRIPARDSNIAWKISGPGISRQFYYQISHENVLILIAAELERIILQRYQSKIEQLIDDPARDISQQINTYFKVFSLNMSFNDPGCTILKKQLQEQLMTKRSKFPRFQQNSKIRFTEQELKYLLIQAKQFIKAQIVLKDMTDFIWSQYQIKQGDYNGLVEKMVKQILGSQVFEPFEDLEMRFQLRDVQGRDIQKQIQRALEGQVNLEIPNQYEIKQKKDIVVEPPLICKRFVSYERIITEINNCQQHEQNWCSALNNQGFYVNYSLI